MRRLEGVSFCCVFTGKIQKDGRKESCKPILKVEYKTSRNRFAFIPELPLAEIEVKLY